MNPNAFLARVASLLPTLAPSPIRSLIAALLIEAGAMDDEFDRLARYQFLRGYLGLPPGGPGEARKPSMALLSDMQRQHGDELGRKLPKGVVDDLLSLRATGMFKRFSASVDRALYANRQSAEEAMQNMMAGLTPKGTPTKPLFYLVGTSLADKGDITTRSIGNLAVAYATRKARDYGKLKKSPTEGAVGFDNPVGEEGGRTLADILADDTDFTMLQTVFDTPEGLQVLGRISETVLAALPSEGQKLVWQAIVENPGLIGSRSESVAGAELARALEAQDYTISSQRAGQLWRAVLDTARKTMAENPTFLAPLEDSRLIKKMLDPRNLGKTAARRVALRYASHKVADDAELGWAALLRAKKLMDQQQKQQKEQIEEQEARSGAYTRIVNVLRQAQPGDVLAITYNDPMRGGEVVTRRVVSDPWDGLRAEHPGSFQRPTVMLEAKVGGRFKQGIVQDYGHGDVYWQPTAATQITKVLDIKKS
jgi:hypothetical protein